MRLGPFMSYYGGKFRLAPKYAAPEHDVLIEPFAGGAGYSIRHHERKVMLYDLDEKVCAVWDFLIRATPHDILSIPLMGPHDFVDDLGVSQEARWLVGYWLCGASSYPRNTPSGWMRSGFGSAQFWGEKLRARLAQQSQLIGHWKVFNAGYASIPNAPATWFVDPPYQVKGSHYRFGSSGLDFAALGEWCQDRRGQVIVCENAGADWLPFEHLHVAKSARLLEDGTQAKSHEVVWYGGVQ